MRGEARRSGGFKLAGSVGSGKGRIEFDGSLDERGEVDVKISGQDFLAADIPAANVVVTPDLALTGNPKGYLLRGEVNIPRAAINLQKFPQDQAPGVSPDVVVVRNGKEVVNEAKAKSLPLQAVVTVNLGEHIEVTGYGLEATVAGQLTVREAPDTPTTGSGQVSLAGRYEAYGQKLTIEDGRLLFAGTPLDNPRLAITAMRKIDDDLSTGVRIAGTAKRPIITVVSQPNVGEADALSYLVTGRSLSDVGSASGSSQDALNSARQSLSGRGRRARGQAHRCAARPGRGGRRGKRDDRRLGADHRRVSLAAAVPELWRGTVRARRSDRVALQAHAKTWECACSAAPKRLAPAWSTASRNNGARPGGLLRPALANRCLGTLFLESAWVAVQ